MNINFLRIIFCLLPLTPLRNFAKSVYVTIDDGPSSNTLKLVSYLKSNNIPAIFYCCGKNIEKYKKSIVLAIKEGFIIGNHSYSHPHFSEISLEEAYEEIRKTENLIDECYVLAKKNRPAKIIRFPYGDRGAGNSGTEITAGKIRLRFPLSDGQEEKVTLLQNLLKKEGFTRPEFIGLYDPEIDSMWSLHTVDYYEECLDKEAASLKIFSKIFKDAAENAVLLLHDKNFNYQLVKERLDFLCKEKVHFILPHFTV